MTWLAILVVASTLGYCHWIGLTALDSDMPSVRTWATTDVDQIGWPCNEATVEKIPTSLTSVSKVYHVQPIGLIANMLVAALLLVSVILIAERMDRASGRSGWPQYLTAGVILATTTLLWRLREPIWERLVAMLPYEVTDVFDTVTDPRPSWMHILHYGLSLAVVNALVVVSWYAVVGIGKAFRAARRPPEAS